MVGIVEGPDNSVRNGLEGRFVAQIGDLIVLTNRESKREAGGYVIGITFNDVVLSHEHPMKKTGYYWDARRSYTLGNRAYVLRFFNDYKIVKKANE